MNEYNSPRKGREQRRECSPGDRAFAAVQIHTPAQTNHIPAQTNVYLL